MRSSGLSISHSAMVHSLFSGVLGSARCVRISVGKKVAPFRVFGLCAMHVEAQRHWAWYALCQHAPGSYVTGIYTSGGVQRLEPGLIRSPVLNFGIFSIGKCLQYRFIPHCSHLRTKIHRLAPLDLLSLAMAFENDAPMAFVGQDGESIKVESRAIFHCLGKDVGHLVFFWAGVAQIDGQEAPAAAYLPFGSPGILYTFTPSTSF